MSVDLAGLLLVLTGLLGAAIGVILFGIWMNWWIDRAMDWIWWV